MDTHPAIVTVGLRAPLARLSRRTTTPSANEVRILVQWAASTPLDLHQNDGGLLVTFPQVLGDSVAGTVVEVGPEVKRLRVGDRVFGFVWESDQERAQQVYVTAKEWKFGVVSIAPGPCYDVYPTV
jgi:NADPH:quinone reductase-like Zn-dependent oxidoreductase